MGLRRLLSIGLAVPISLTSALVMGLSHASSADLLGLNPVTVDCGDGAPIHANVDLLELTKLQGVMQAMLADSAPGSDRCGMQQDSQREEHESHPFVIGAGTYGGSLCELKFKIKASIADEGRVHGFQRVSAPPDNCGTGPGRGELKANVICLAVNGKVAEMRGIVTESTGPLFATYLGIAPGDVLFTQAQENPTGTPDQIFQDKGAPNSENDCVATLDPLAFPLDSGDIDVRD